jgi:DNA invertase Pin-like site-specific DNA recombinase
MLYGKVLRDGDILKVTRLDRLGRSVLHLVTLGAELRERGVGLAAARARGRVGGRRPKLSPQQAAMAQQQYDGGKRPSSRSPTCSVCRARRVRLPQP